MYTRGYSDSESRESWIVARLYRRLLLYSYKGTVFMGTPTRDRRALNKSWCGVRADTRASNNNKQSCLEQEQRRHIIR